MLPRPHPLSLLAPVLALTYATVSTATAQVRAPSGGLEFCDTSVELRSAVQSMTQRYYSHVYRVETDRLTRAHNDWRKRTFTAHIPWKLDDKSVDGAWAVTSVRTECHYYESATVETVRNSRDRHILDGNLPRARLIEVHWPRGSLVSGDGEAISYGYHEDRDNHTPSRLTMQFRDQDAAEQVVDIILAATNLSRNFAVLPSYDISNAAAYYDANNNRVLAYNPDFMLRMRRRTGTDWAGVSIMAHEIGHHVNDHLNQSHRTTYRATPRQFELQADYFSGGTMHRLGASLREAQAALRELGASGSRTHPPVQQRLNEIARGWTESHSNLGDITEVDPRVTPLPRSETRPPDPPPDPSPSVGATCYTAYGACYLPSFGRIGASCYCNTWYGAIPGAVGM